MLYVTCRCRASQLVKRRGEERRGEEFWLWSEKESESYVQIERVFTKKKAEPVVRAQIRSKKRRWLVFFLGPLRLAQPYPPSESTQFRLGFKHLLLDYRAFLLKVEDDILVEVSLQTISRSLLLSPSHGI